MDRREFLLGIAAGTTLPIVAGCRTTGTAVGGKSPSIRPPRFQPITFPGMEPKPDFWKVRPNEIIEICERAKKCSRKEVICHTPLGYPVYALFYGDFSEPPPQSNWSAGSSSRTYRSYYGDRKDGVQTFLFLAGIHGAEQECVAAAMNLVQMLETGRDFRGRTDAELLKLIGQYRFIVVPCVNMDGRSISPDHLRGLNFEDFRRASQGYWKDGSLIGWRGSKCWFPLPLDKVAYPGGYPNSEGFNIQHDACPGNIRTAEARAILQLAERWRVDAVLNGHSYEWAPSVLCPSAIALPQNVERELDIRQRTNRALVAAGLRATEPQRGKAGDGFTINVPLALACGALVLTLECSVAYDKPIKGEMRPTRQYTFDEMMEPPFVVLREYLADGLERPFLIRGDEKEKGD
ncbi:MAG: hypothetical protein IJR99_11670 [Kiritimatiellae bacterium]|nr:hypothetical protein [Kiritimatiellia bacterium]